MVVLTFLTAHWKAAIILAIVLVLALGGVRWCRKPTPLSVNDANKPAKMKIDKTTEDRLRKIIADRERDLKAERAKSEQRRKAAEAKAALPFDTALKGGLHAMPELATVWTAPGTAEQLRARWRAAADPAH